MSQNQLLTIIVISIIIVIGAVVVINTSENTSQDVDLTSVRNDLTSMGEAAKTYYLKPKSMSGGGKKFKGITFDDISSGACDPSINIKGSFAGDDLTCSNENGNYIITKNNLNDQVIIKAVPKNGKGSMYMTVTEDNITIGDYIEH